MLIPDTSGLVLLIYSLREDSSGWTKWKVVDHFTVEDKMYELTVEMKRTADASILERFLRNASNLLPPDTHRSKDRAEGRKSASLAKTPSRTAYWIGARDRVVLCTAKASRGLELLMTRRKNMTVLCPTWKESSWDINLFNFPTYLEAIETLDEE